MRVPCKNCQERELGCHSVCSKYIEYKEYMERVTQAKRANEGIDVFLMFQSERRHKHPNRKRKQYGTSKI